MSPASSDSGWRARAAGLLARPGLRDLLSALNTDGEDARVVGGAVRDLVMDRPIGDIDIAATALPQEVERRCRAHGWKVVPTGIEHGTVTVVIGKVPYEVTTLRRDVETDGRRAVVAFTRDFREDAFRRDFTINALSIDAAGGLHDYATGLADAAAGRIRFMGDAETRIREDYLRILRYFRFAATHARTAPDKSDLAVIARLKDGMARLSRERIRQELLKLLAAPGAADVSAVMAEIALWPQIAPGGEARVSVLRHMTALEAALALPPDPLRRLAALAPWSAGMAEDLRLSRQEQADLTALRAHAARFHEPPGSNAELRRAAFEAGRHVVGAAVLGMAEAGVPAGEAAAALARLRPYADKPPVNPFTSAMAAELGVAPGPAMGAVLKRALARWLDAGLPDAPADVSSILAAAAADVRATAGD